MHDAVQLLRPVVLLAILLSIACHTERADPVRSVAAAGQLRHYDIRADQLPPPYRTPSAGNPPRVASEPRGASLDVPPGFHVSVFAADLDDPRKMILAPNGDVILSEPGAGKVTILRDANHDGLAEQRFAFLSGLDEPYGLALHDGFLYIGDENAVVRVPYKPGDVRSTARPQQIAPLPTGGHSTRGLLFSPDGTKLYVSVGSHSNVSTGEPPERAAILQMNPDGSGRRIFASGLRNPVDMAWNPESGTLWTVVNERDGLGDDLPPDYATDVTPGAFYGWPYAYIGAHEDPRHKGERPDLVSRTTVPAVLIQAHSAPLGIAFDEGSMFPARYRGSAFVAVHGSWNRGARTGYKVIDIPFHDGRPAGGYDDFLAGWMPDPQARSVWGRPVGVLVLGDGSLLVSDDGGETIWRVTYSGTR
ncbi:MAG TPA: sorbosone dehydrogenase family protein [Thermoanaerobaculia bacterium]|nr:sorbosone dehydrogenase family protein [Thermoanaerobaculia bacterium]